MARPVTTDELKLVLDMMRRLIDLAAEQPRAQPWSVWLRLIEDIEDMRGRLR